MNILGISALYHDSAAALVRDGDVVAAAQEERFTRTKGDARFPMHAIRFCLAEGGVDPRGLDHVVFYDKPHLKFHRLLSTYLAFAPRGFEAFAKSMPSWLTDKLFQRTALARQLGALDPDVPWTQRILFSEHHQSHAASAFYPSPFEAAAILTLDGVGEWATTSMSIGRGNDLTMLKEIRFPHSLGLLYSAFTAYLGFRVNFGEYKVMGLAPYGSPRFRDVILEEMVDLKKDGSFRLNLDYFDYCTGSRMTSDKFEQLLDGPTRMPEAELDARHMDIAASIQSVIDEATLRLARSIAHETGLPNLCLAGGVALNCVANGKILRDGCFERIWIQPAAGDAGGALGAALAAYYALEDRPRPADPTTDRMQGGLLGPSFSQCEVEERLQALGARYDVVDDQVLIDRTVDAICDQKVVGWFQDRMEYGPRSLGSRSILGDPRSPEMQRVLNLKVKQRESFRPFAPAVLQEDVSEWFDFEGHSPYMLFVVDVTEARRRPISEEDQQLVGFDRLRVRRSEIPAVTHIDGSARIQTVDSEVTPRFHELLSAFKRRTGCPVLINTSFNVRGEPIVCTPEDAFRCFLGTGIDVLAIGNCFLEKQRHQDIAVLQQAGRFQAD